MAGIRQFIEILEKHGLTGSEVTLEKVLHLKTGVNYIENNNMPVSGEFIDKPEGYPVVEKSIRDAGYEVILVDTSEYKKLDGGLSCLPLRF